MRTPSDSVTSATVPVISTRAPVSSSGTTTGRVNRVLLLLSVPWALLLAAALAFAGTEEAFRTLARASVVYPILYLGTAWVASLRRVVSGDAPLR